MFNYARLLNENGRAFFVYLGLIREEKTMLKIVSKEESQLIDLYRKIKNAYNRYHCAEYIRINAKNETGEEEKIPTALEKCDSIYIATISVAKDIDEIFSGKERDQAIEELTETVKRDMERAYYGK